MRVIITLGEPAIAAAVFGKLARLLPSDFPRQLVQNTLKYNSQAEVALSGGWHLGFRPRLGVWQLYWTGSRVVPEIERIIHLCRVEDITCGVEETTLPAR